MRKLKLDEAALQRLLDELDAQDEKNGAVGLDDCPFYAYRIPALRVDLDVSRDQTVSHMSQARRLGARGIVLLVNNLVHSGCTCRLHLVTVRNNWQTVEGRVVQCRYLQGTAGVHEIYVRFARPVDPATFATAASRARILVAEDSPVSQRLYEHLLESLNVELSFVSNGLEAVQRAADNTFDLILMDLEMPELDGLSAVDILRSKGYLRSIVMISALSDEATRKRCLLAGCDDFLAKPVTRSALADMVNRNTPEPLVSALLHEAGMADLIDQFVGNLAGVIAELEKCFGEQNFDELARAARSLKGEAGGIGFESLSLAADDVEDAASQNADSTTVRAKLTQLIRLCLAARPATTSTG